MYYIGIDPSSNTGIVILDEEMNVVVEEIISETNEDKVKKAIEISKGVIGLIIDTCEIWDCILCIEGFSFGSRGKSVDFQYGLGYLIRQQLNLYDIKYTDVAPSKLKKYATGKGNCNKDVVMREVYKKWGYENNDNNIVDAYVLARMAKEFI